MTYTVNTSIDTSLDLPRISNRNNCTAKSITVPATSMMLPRAALRVFRCFSQRNLTPSSHLYANEAPAPQIWCRHWTDGTPKPALSSYDRFVLKITRTVKGEIPTEARYVAEGLQNIMSPVV